MLEELKGECLEAKPGDNLPFLARSVNGIPNGQSVVFSLLDPKARCPYENKENSINGI